jgi:polysaccharide biosynthesis protein PslG
MALAGAIMPDSLSANRFHVQWAAVEPSEGARNWTRTDAVYTAMQRHTVRPIMMLYGAPGWARDPAATCPAANPCAYPPLAQHDGKWKQFVRAAVTRYPNVRAIEIWNEANLRRFWAPAVDPKRYAAILMAAHGAVLAARSSAPVLVGGVYPATTNGKNMSAGSFLREVYARAGTGAFEGIGTHPYPRQAPFVETMWQWLDELRAVRDEYGDSATPLWITEVGVSTAVASGGVPLDQQGDVLAELYRSIEGHDIASFVIHRLHDIGIEGSYWNQTGVLYEDLTRKPAYCELGAAIGTAC